jgi:hypothetical protein
MLYSSLKFSRNVQFYLLGYKCKLSNQAMMMEAINSLIRSANIYLQGLASQKTVFFIVTAVRT